jgi:hypothetical protein
MSVSNRKASQRRADVRQAAHALLSLKLRYGTAAIREAVEMAKQSELRICAFCSEWTRHMDGKCQPCREFFTDFGY